jgi:hypothetical protein
MTVSGLSDTVFCFSRPCECHLYTAPRNRREVAGESCLCSQILGLVLPFDEPGKIEGGEILWR